MRGQMALVAICYVDCKVVIIHYNSTNMTVKLGLLLGLINNTLLILSANEGYFDFATQ
jgi:hypothetical protein